MSIEETIFWLGVKRDREKPHSQKRAELNNWLRMLRQIELRQIARNRQTRSAAA
jgi:hypothetical protein